MPEDATKETAATSEPPGGSRWRLRLASQEFFFLLQRIDRLDEKLTGEVKTIAGELKAVEERVNARIDRLDEKLSGEIKTLDGKLNTLNEKISNKFNNLTLWTVGILITIVVGFIAVLLR